MDQGISVKTMIGLLGVALLGGCGQYLGDQRFEHVRLVTTKPGDAAEPYDGAGPYPYGRYLEVEFSSPLDLTPVAMHNAIYVHSDYCPDPDRRRVSAFGPYADGSALLHLCAGPCAPA